MERNGKETENGCPNCRFWVGIGEDGSIGECRRYAPAPFPLSILKLKELGDGAPHNDATWPVTGIDDWCGEWECELKIAGMNLD